MHASWLGCVTWLVSCSSCSQIWSADGIINYLIKWAVVLIVRETVCIRLCVNDQWSLLTSTCRRLVTSSPCRPQRCSCRPWSYSDQSRWSWSHHNTTHCPAGCCLHNNITITMVTILLNMQHLVPVIHKGGLYSEPQSHEDQIREINRYKSNSTNHSNLQFNDDLQKRAKDIPT